MNTLKNLIMLGAVLTTLSSLECREMREGRDSDFGDRYSRDRDYNYEGHYHNDYRHYDGRGYYRGFPVYYNGGYDGGIEYIPSPDAESYNDITNPELGDGSSSNNFQNSNFDNQIWDIKN